MSAAHGGQVLLSQAVAALVRERLPADVALRDLGCVRLRDLAHDPNSVYQVAASGAARQDFPALRSLERTPNNLPQQVTSFIGRERELAEVKAAARDDAAVDVASGVGGIGKTRLSLQVAADVWTSTRTACGSSNSRALTDPRLVPQAVASVLGVKEEAGRPVLRGAGQVRARTAPAAGPRQLRAPGRRRAPSSRASCCSAGPG